MSASLSFNMSRSKPAFTSRLAPLVAAACLAMAPLRADAPAKSTNVVVNLINRMVERGLLPREDADELIRHAEADAAEARATQATVAQLAAAATQPVAAASSSSTSATAPATSADASGTVRVTYIPGSVRRQMVQEVKQEVMDQAYTDHWAAPHQYPEWLTRLTFFGDLRVRYEGIYFPTNGTNGNDNTGAFPNFNAINTGAPFDVAGTVFSPQLDVDQDRTRVRLRARAGLAFDLGEGFTSGLRVATGENNSPVSPNQSLGAAGSGQGGSFSKYALWLDRAFLRYDVGSSARGAAVSLGRFENPFFASTMIWDDDIGLDGAALQGRYELWEGVRPYAVAGLFPVYNTDLNFATNRPDKFKSEDKWLEAAQLGADWRIRRDLALKLGVAYYDFQNIAGKLSAPFVPLTSSDAGNTDATRPAFAQKGNTYMALRNITPSVLNNYGTINQWQYFGLATPFRDVAATGKLDFTHFEPFTVSLSGEFVQNIAFHRGAVAKKAVNNFGTATSGGAGAFDGGDTGWTVNLQVGDAVLAKRWDWNLSFGYRYLESDAVVDGFTDSDFGGGGTNLEGFMTGASLALSKRVWVSARWLSAHAITGPTFKNDTLQLDANAKF